MQTLVFSIVLFSQLLLAFSKVKVQRFTICFARQESKLYLLLRMLISLTI